MIISRILILLALLLGYLVCPSISASFNQSMASSCIYGCLFTNESIWDNQIVPYNDTAIITIPSTDITVVLILNESIPLTTLQLEGPVELKIINTSIEVGDILAYALVTLTLQDVGQVVAYGSTVFIDGAQLILSNSGAFAQGAGQFSVDAASSVEAYGASYLGLHAPASIYGEVSFDPSSLFIATADVYFYDQEYIYFQNFPTIYNAHFIRSNATFFGGLKGNITYVEDNSNVTVYRTLLKLSQLTIDTTSTLFLRRISDCSIFSPNITGTLFISTSNVRINDTTAFGSPLVLAGESDFTVSNYDPSVISFQNGEDGEAPNVNIMTDILYLSGNFAIWGEVYVNTFAIFRGSTWFSGGVNVAGSLLVDGNVSIARSLSVGNGPMLVSLGKAADPSELRIFNHSAITTPVIYIGENTTLEVFESAINGSIELFYGSQLFDHNGIYLGNIYNEGYISVRPNHTINIIGNYTQGTNGIFNVFDLDLANQSSSGYLHVVGTAKLDGKIAFSILYNPLDNKRKEVLVVVSDATIIGKFQDTPVNIGDLVNEASMEYYPHSVFLTFGKDSGSGGHEIGWWVWLLVALGIVLVIGLLLLFIAKRKRSDYGEIPTH